jgi:beta-glucosidase
MEKMIHKHMLSLLLTFTMVLIGFPVVSQIKNVPGTAVYKNPAMPVKLRIDDLLSRMTLEEKIGQLNMPCVYISELGRSIPAKTENCRKLAEGTFLEFLGPIGGFFTLANNILHEGTLQQANYFNELQKIAIEKTRLGIPLLQTEEGTHGLMCSGGTVFPEGLAIGSTWNMDLVNKIYHCRT